MKRAAWWLKSLYELQLRTIQASPWLCCDETPMPVLDPRRHRTGAASSGRMAWMIAMGQPVAAGVAYMFADGRGTAEIAE